MKMFKQPMIMPLIVKNLRKTRSLALWAMALNMLAAPAALAHARWVLPSHTVISGDKPLAVSFDYSISNDIFHPDIALGGVSLGENKENSGQANNPMMAIMAKTQASVVTPKGDEQLLEAVNLGRKTSTYFTASEGGTYRVDIHQPPIDLILFKNKAGESQRLFGRYDAVKNKIPAGASAIEPLQIFHHMQTFVTYNATSAENLAPKGEGLEIKHRSHPNEIFAQEKSNYLLLLDGKPVADAQIKITRAGTRFRNQRASMEPTISNAGEFEVTWPEAGFYLIEIEHEIKRDIGKVVHALFLTVEIHPE